MAEKELHLFIIWEKARTMEDKILQTIQNNFTILERRYITWPKDVFSKNLTRFYGENLPSSSKKIQECGDGEFILVIVEDSSPVYKPRLTTKGCKVVNVNMFDAKELFRFWTGSSRVHGTNSQAEVDHDLTLLTGKNSRDYIKYYQENKSNEPIITHSDSELIGAKGWKSIEEFFYVLNNCIDYVILRNFEEMPEKITMGKHGDVDFLCYNLKQMVLLSNSKPVFRSKDRVRNVVNIANEELFCDFRYIGDGYYDKQWEEDILSRRVFFKNLFYVPDERNLYYTLLYHALIQKNKIADDYVEKLKTYRGAQNEELPINSRVLLIKELISYLKEKGYSISTPKDYSVVMNVKDTGAKSSTSYFLKHEAYKAIRRIKR